MVNFMRGKHENMNHYSESILAVTQTGDQPRTCGLPSATRIMSSRM
jgi:hypothetical protein